jgi:hypothetical protein
MHTFVNDLERPVGTYRAVLYRRVHAAWHRRYALGLATNDTREAQIRVRLTRPTVGVAETLDDSPFSLGASSRQVRRSTCVSSPDPALKENPVGLSTKRVPYAESRKADRCPSHGNATWCRERASPRRSLLLGGSAVCLDERDIRRLLAVGDSSVRSRGFAFLQWVMSGVAGACIEEGNQDWGAIDVRISDGSILARVFPKRAGLIKVINRSKLPQGSYATDVPYPV